MISIIISTYQPHYLEALIENIEATIGDVVYEIVPMHNPGKMGICETYNRGAEQAQYPFLCFVHEDVLFETQNWGALLIAHLEKPNIGAIGVAGSAYKCKVPLSWSVVKKFRASNILQQNENDTIVHIVENPNEDTTYRVVALDGVFIATTKKIWENIPFDQARLKGFHGYDVDFSLSVAQQHEVHVVFDILLKHFSKGNPNKDWLKASILVAKKWNKKLPYSCIPLDGSEMDTIEQFCKARFKRKLNHYNMSWWHRQWLLLMYG